MMNLVFLASFFLLPTDLGRKPKRQGKQLRLRGGGQTQGVCKDTDHDFSSLKFVIIFKLMSKEEDSFLFLFIVCSPILLPSACQVLLGTRR